MDVVQNGGCIERRKPRPRRSFAPEFKAEIVELCRRPVLALHGVASRRPGRGGHRPNPRRGLGGQLTQRTDEGETRVGDRAVVVEHHRQARGTVRGIALGRVPSDTGNRCFGKFNYLIEAPFRGSSAAQRSIRTVYSARQCRLPRWRWPAPLGPEDDVVEAATASFRRPRDRGHRS